MVVAHYLTTLNKKEEQYETPNEKRTDTYRSCGRCYE
jgi:hypothetical protein